MTLSLGAFPLDLTLGAFGNFTPGFWPSGVGSAGGGLFHKFALNLARRSSRDTACLNVRMMVLDAVKGSRRGISPTEFTVSLWNKSF